MGIKTNPKSKCGIDLFSLKRAGISSYKLVVCKTLKGGMSIKVACTVYVRASSRAADEASQSSPQGEYLLVQE